MNQSSSWKSEDVPNGSNKSNDFRLLNTELQKFPKPSGGRERHQSSASTPPLGGNTQTQTLRHRNEGSGYGRNYDRRRPQRLADLQLEGYTGGRMQAPYDHTLQHPLHHINLGRQHWPANTTLPLTSGSRSHSASNRRGGTMSSSISTRQHREDGEAVTVVGSKLEGEAKDDGPVTYVAAGTAPINTFRTVTPPLKKMSSSPVSVYAGPLIPQPSSNSLTRAASYASIPSEISGNLSFPEPSLRHVESARRKHHSNMMEETMKSQLHQLQQQHHDPRSILKYKDTKKSSGNENTHNPRPQHPALNNQLMDNESVKSALIALGFFTALQQRYAQQQAAATGGAGRSLTDADVAAAFERVISMMVEEIRREEIRREQQQQQQQQVGAGSTVQHPHSPGHAQQMGGGGTPHVMLPQIQVPGPGGAANGAGPHKQLYPQIVGRGSSQRTDESGPFPNQQRSQRVSNGPGGEMGPNPIPEDLLPMLMRLMQQMGVAQQANGAGAPQNPNPQQQQMEEEKIRQQLQQGGMPQMGQMVMNALSKMNSHVVQQQQQSQHGQAVSRERGPEPVVLPLQQHQQKQIPTALPVPPPPPPPPPPMQQNQQGFEANKQECYSAVVSRTPPLMNVPSPKGIVVGSPHSTTVHTKPQQPSQENVILPSSSTSSSGQQNSSGSWNSGTPAEESTTTTTTTTTTVASGAESRRSTITSMTEAASTADTITPPRGESGYYSETTSPSQACVEDGKQQKRHTSIGAASSSKSTENKPSNPVCGAVASPAPPSQSKAPCPPPTSPLTPSGQFEVSKMDVLSEEIWHYHNSVTQTETMLNRKLQLRDMLYYSICPVFPMCGLYVVGSSLNGFGNNSSDMDLCLMITNKDLDQKTDAVVVLNMILSTLQRIDWVAHQQLILAKVPILRIKFAHPFADITVDLNANNSVAIKNTHLLCYYSSFDWRVRPLVSVVKEWAKRKGINDANRSSFTSYSLVLMVIHYLQCGADPAVLPSLQQLYPRRFTNKCDVRALNVTVPLQATTSEQEWQFSDKATLGELLIGFLDYYANKFDYNRDAISVRQGKRVDRAVIAKQRPNTGYHNPNWRSQWRCICIEEPFTYSNTAHSIYDEMTFNAIKEALREAHDDLDSNRDLQKLLRCKPITVNPPIGGAPVYSAQYDGGGVLRQGGNLTDSSRLTKMGSGSASSLSTAHSGANSSASSISGEEAENDRLSESNENTPVAVRAMNSVVVPATTILKDQQRRRRSPAATPVRQ